MLEGPKGISTGDVERAVENEGGEKLENKVEVAKEKHIKVSPSDKSCNAKVVEPYQPPNTFP